MSKGKRTAADELAVAIEDGDLERHVGVLEHARSRPPACSRNEISEGKIFLYRMLEGFRRRIRRQDALAQCRRRAYILRERGKRAQVYGTALRVQIEKTLRELGHLRDAAGDGEFGSGCLRRYLSVPPTKSPMSINATSGKP